MLFQTIVLFYLPACSEYELTKNVNIEDGKDTGNIVIDTGESIVDTGGGDSGAPEIEEAGPVAVCNVTPNPVTPPFTAATFDGSSSYDQAGGIITSYIWNLVESPEGSSVGLPYNSGMYISDFYPDLAGEYIGELIVTNDLGYTDVCQVVLEAIPAQSLWIEMFWQHSGDDMDLHLLAPGGILETDSDCYYANCAWASLDWGIPGAPEDDPSLDIDDISGIGPENINIYSPQTDGVYTVYVHDYPGSVFSGSNDVTINIYLNGSIVWTGTKPILTEASYTPYAIIDWASQSVTPL